MPKWLRGRSAKPLFVGSNPTAVSIYISNKRNMKKNVNVLVLNRSYIPVQIAIWKKAIARIYTGDAKPLDRDYIAYSYEDWLKFSNSVTDYPVLSTATLKIAVPEIIVLTRFDYLPKQDIKYTRPNIFERDNFTCAYCGHQYDKKNLNIDHIIPRDYGGKSTWENTITSCYNCNSKKRNRTPEEAHMPLLFKPTKPRWRSPITKRKGSAHGCKSWELFLNRANVMV